MLISPSHLDFPTMTRGPLDETFSVLTRPRKPPGAIASPLGPSPLDVEIDERLRAWGYD